MQIAWGAKVSSTFKAAVLLMCEDYRLDPNFLMACMAFESGETFSSDIHNAAGSGAVGLIQFVPQTAGLLHTSTEELAGMSAEDQLAYVEEYFAPYKYKLKTLSDVYMAILWPSAIGKPEDAVIFDSANANHPKLYLQNKGLDLDRNGKITKAEAASAVLRKLLKGMKPGFVG